MIAQDESINSELDIINCYASTRVSTPEYPVPGTSVSQVKPRDYPVTHVSSHLSSLKGESGIHTNPEPSTDNLLSYKENRKANTNPSLTLVDEMLSMSSVRKVRNENGQEATSDNDSEMEGPDLPFIPTSSSEWQDRGAAKIVTTTTDENGVTRTTVVKKSIKDFIMGKTLGEGSYSTVILAKDKSTKKKYAMKILDKRYIVNEKKVKYVNIEKHTLNRLSKHVGIIHLFYTFQDEQSLYFVLDYASNGELYTLIKKYGSMDLDSVRYYSAQILDAIKYIHDNGVIHRDIKPENILINEQMKIQITDFGTAKLLEKNEDGEYPTNVRATSFVGTAEYVSPELLNEKYVGKPCDIWAFGCLIYQMISGKPAFKATNDYLVFQKICKLNYAFTAGFPTIVRDLVKRIFVLKPSNRITISEIQKHMFFESIDWSDPDAIWNTDPPELGPYKMSAQSMLPIPGLKNKTKPYLPSKTNSSPIVKRATSSTNSPTQPKLVSQNSSPVLMQGKNAPDQRSASSAAAVALSRSVPNNASTSRLQAPNSASSTSSNKQDFIPGTNIPRPTVQRHSSKQLLASGAGSRKSSTSSLPPSKPEPVHPMTVLDLKWSSYLTHHDERILKADVVDVFEMTTDQVEKKFRGQLVDSPLGSNGRRTSGTSMLTQVVNGASGFRKQSTVNTNGGSPEPNTDSSIPDQAITYVEPQQLEDGSKDSTERDREKEPDKEKDTKKSSVAERFMKALHGNVSSQPVETKPIKHMLVITSFGRALLFEVSGVQPNPTYELRSTIDLVNLNVKFKEVMGETRKQKNSMINTGLFVIESTKYSFVFEVPKHEISIWTSTLLRSRTNEHDRKYWRDSMAAGNVGTSTGGEGALKAATQAASVSANHKELEPSLLAPMKPISPLSSHFDWDATATDIAHEKVTSRKSQDGGGLAEVDILLSPAQEISKSSERPSESHTPAPSTHNSKNRGERMMKTIESSHGRRKPPPPIPQTGHLSNGLPLRSRASNTDNAMVNAAINSIMNHPEVASGPESSAREGSVNRFVTGLNSRFLARSSRKR
ncbi:Serine/threonine-protein kinase [Komagataella phaffii CBS 7435]|uniref:non-specific serine/threonine protein kinase n=1 Tax=Komagataella phaffii (strain ATCC 76273 / CBS 7435 / CECT 11047 / NRRL Y-11430 / Wegner 21-1) TaxID=981350 RepID=F2QX87_KOMPC|nr:GQ68_03168T0 [Komagataella phaffii GS115]CAH2450109.1 Serine/threonine-protein kinase [Komagataella phaffii CBS 7435]CCA40015.1 Serine/threonine-protein kinase [Komagataella phaffii CBS 7435]